ncbi:MAG TPA: hypothetical protein VMT53_11925 [Terriglobales bacterium]|nr:hypothetical protein [Terriglobales bacterium]
MKNSLKHTLVAVVCLATIYTAAAQNKSAKRSTARTHSEIRHRSSNVAVPDESRKLNSDLTKLETRTSRSLKPARAHSEKKVALASKSAAAQGRRSNPPINFTYSGRKSASAAHGGTASRSGNAKTGRRLK